MRFRSRVLVPLLAAAPAALAGPQAPAPRPVVDARVLAALIDSIVPVAMTAQRIPGVVVSVVSGGRVIFSRGYGVADLESRRPMSADSTIVRIGSISKVMTATAVVQLADRDRIRLDADVNGYLKSVKVPATYAAPVTTFQLLTHTAALDEIRPGTQAETKAGLLPLGKFLESRLVRYAPPGIATAYSTYGMTLAGALVEDVSGLSFEDYLRRNVWLPLGMTLTSIDVPAAQQRLVAIPYDVEDDKPVKAPWEWYHTTPAASVNSTAADMARYMISQLGGTSPVLSERMTREMQRQQITMHPLLPGWGLGWQQLRIGAEPGVQHGGDVAGFSSLLTLLPARGFGIFVAGHREGSDLRFSVSRAVLERFFPDREPKPRPVSMHPTVAAAAAAAARYAGHYRANIVCHSCASPRPVSEVDVLANRDGTLSAFGGRFLEVSPRFFRSQDGERRFGFREDSLGRITHLTVGSWQVLERVPMAGAGTDSALIRNAVLDYVEGWYEGNAERMESALHPELAKRIWRPDPERGNDRLDHMGAMALVQGTRRGGGSATPMGDRRAEVRILDIYGNAASVRAGMANWVDLMHLVRMEGRWRVVNVLWELSAAEAGEGRMPGRAP